MKMTAMVLMLLLAAGLFGQADPNAWVRTLGEKTVAAGGDGARLVAMLVGSEGADEQASIEALRKKGVIRGSFDPSRPLTLGTLSLLIMRAKGFSGGLMYSLFGSARYAYRELIYRKLLPPGSSEHAPVSGGLLLSVIAATRGDVRLDMKGGGK